MAFFARPNLDDTQFRQLPNSTLSLSGQTQILSVSGLTLPNGSGDNVIVTAQGYAGAGSNGYVLTQDSDGVIKLMPSSASGGSTVYTYTDITTCTVGGLPAGQCLYNDPLVDIIHCMLSPTLQPSTSTPTIKSFNLYCAGTTSTASSTYEVGRVLMLSACICYNPGSVSAVYSGNSSCYGGLPSCYVYTQMFGIPDISTCCTTPTFCRCVGDSPTSGSHIVTLGDNSISARIKYTSGATIYDSSGTPIATQPVSGYTPTCTKSFSGVYPWFWGIISGGGAPAGSNRPTASDIKTIISTGTGNKVVKSSTGTISTTFNSTSDDYIWFATPATSTTKTCWYVDALNNSGIGGGVSAGGCLFPSPETITDVDSSLGCWSGLSYKVYISNYQSAATVNMELRNS